MTGIVYRPNVLSAAQPTVSEHWRKHKAMTTTSGPASSVLQPPSDRSTQPSTLRGTVKWVPAKGRWCSVAGKETAGLAKSNGSQPPDDLSHLRADCLYNGISSKPDPR